MNYDKHKYKSSMRNRLVLYFEIHGQKLDDEVADFLLEHIVNFLDFLYKIKDTTILYQRYIKEILFRKLLKNIYIDKKAKKRIRRKIIRLRYRVFSFLIAHQYLVEKTDAHKEHIRATYDIGHKYMSLRFDLLSDMEKIKEYVSSELYEFLLKEGISSYFNFLELQHLQGLPFEELEEKIEGASLQKELFSNQLCQANTILTSVDIPQVLRAQIKGKRISALNYSYAFDQSEKLFRIALKIKSNMKFASELTIDNMNNKSEEIYSI